MTTFQTVREFLEQNQNELVYELKDNERTAFQEAITKLQRDWNELPNDDIKLDITLREMRKYSTVWRELSNAGLVEAEQSVVSSPHILTPTIHSEADAIHLPTVPQQRTQASQLTHTAHRDKSGSEGDEPPSHRMLDRIAWSKELIAGIMGVLIVLVTLVVAISTIFTVSNAETHAALKDVLLFMNGLVGVVLGYYFGRVPGDTRADRAESQAKTANRDRDRVVATVRTILNTSSTASTQRGPSDVRLTQEQVENLRQVLRQYGE